MSRIKHLSRFVILFVLIIGMMSHSFLFMTCAASSPALSIDSKTANAGDEFTVAVKLQNAAYKVYNGNFTLQYDSSKLEAVSYSYGSIFNDHTKNCNLNYQSAGNQIRFTFSGAYALKQDGTLVSITFKTKSTASGEANLLFTAYKLYDENGNSLGGTADGATIKISQKTTVTPKLSLTGGTVEAGKTITVPIKIEKSSGVYNGNFTLQYDSSKLEAVSYSYGSIFNDHTKNCNLNYQSAGNQIRFTFSGAYALKQDGTLVSITFKAKTTASGEANLLFTAYKLYDENGNSLGGTADGATIKISQKTTVTPKLSLTGGTVEAGKTITVPIKIEKSSGVYNGNFTLQYDSSKLIAVTYSYGSIFNDHTKNCNLNYQSAGNKIRFTFSGAYALKQDGTLVTVTFKAKTTASREAALKFTEYKLYDENGSSLGGTADGASIKISQKVAETPKLSLTGGTVDPGKIITVPIKIEKSSSVCNGNFILQYDSNKLEAVFNIFGDIFDDHTKYCNLNYQSSGNQIRFTFSGAHTLKQDGTLVTIKFKAKTTASGEAALKFTEYKLYDENGSSLGGTADGASIKISQTPAAASKLSLTGGTVEAGKTVTVPIKIKKSSDVYNGYFALQYDRDKLEALSYSYGDIFNDHTKNCNLNDQSAGNQIIFSFIGDHALKQDGILLNIKFAVKENASGTAFVRFSVFNLYDNNGKTINTEASDGTVTISSKSDSCNHSALYSYPAESSTCIKQGHEAYSVCANCGKIVKGSDAKLPYTDHTYIEQENKEYLKTEATCSNKAVYYKSCSVCGKKSNETYMFGDFDINNHTGNTYVKNQKQATWLEPGYTGDIYCKDCNEKISEGEIIPALNDSDDPTATDPTPSQNAEFNVVIDGKMNKDAYITVKVTLKNALGLQNGSFLLDFDKSALQYVSCEKNDKLQNNSSVGLNYDGIFVCSLMYSDYCTENNLYLFTVTFKVLKTADTVLSVSSEDVDFTTAKSVSDTEVRINAESAPTDPQPTQPNPSYLLGDVNGDKKINSSDARLALRIALKLDQATGTAFSAADVNYDKKVTSSDARIILRVALKLQQF